MNSTPDDLTQLQLKTKKNFHEISAQHRGLSTETRSQIVVKPHTGFVPFFGNKFLGLFQDSDWFFQDSEIHINPFNPKIAMLHFLAVCHTLHIFYLSSKDFHNFPELSRTSSLFPGLSCPGKCYNKIPGLSRFSRTRTKPAHMNNSASQTWTITILL